MIEREVQPHVAKSMLDEGGDEFVLLDIREPEELERACIQGAVHIPMGQIPERLNSLDPSKQYVVFCHHGMRSQQVMHFLQQRKFGRVSSMKGGIDAWSLLVDSSVPRY